MESIVIDVLAKKGMGCSNSSIGGLRTLQFTISIV